MTELQYSEACVVALGPQEVSFQGAEQRILKSVGTREKRLLIWPCRLVHPLETAPLLHWSESGAALHGVYKRLAVLVISLRLESRTAVIQHGEANFSWRSFARCTCWKECLDFSGQWTS